MAKPTKKKASKKAKPSDLGSGTASKAAKAIQNRKKMLNKI